MDHNVDPFTVSDWSMLSREARDMCKGRELHWLVPKTGKLFKQVLKIKDTSFFTKFLKTFGTYWK